MCTRRTTAILAAAALTGLIAGATPAKAASLLMGRGGVDAARAGGKLIPIAEKDKDACKGPGGCGASKTAGKHECKGKNACKGQGGCNSGDNGCKGKNSCKGHGGCNTTEGRTETQPKSV